MIRGSDGYDYEDLAARIRGEKAHTQRNLALTGAEHRGKELWRERHGAYFDAYRETYTHYEGLGYASDVCRASAHAQANFSADQARGGERLVTGVPDRARHIARALGRSPCTVILDDPAADGPAGAGGAHPGQAPADPVHAAD